MMCQRMHWLFVQNQLKCGRTVQMQKEILSGKNIKKIERYLINWSEKYLSALIFNNS